MTKAHISFLKVYSSKNNAVYVYNERLVSKQTDNKDIVAKSLHLYQ
jgi:hypothetical protein